MALAVGSRCLEAEWERSCSRALRGATEVRRLPPALAVAGPTGWKISVRRKKEGGLVPGAVGGGSVSSYLPLQPRQGCRRSRLRAAGLVPSAYG